MRLARLIALAGCLMSSATTAEAEELRVGDRTRRYELYQPYRVAGTRQPMPVLMLLHAGGMTATEMRQKFGMDAIAAREGFAVVYPEAEGEHWDDGRLGIETTQGSAFESGDVAFIRKLSQHLVNKGVAIPGAMAIAGIANGGMMAMRVACETDGLFTGVATAIANMPVPLMRVCKPRQPLPMALIMGTADAVMPYGGGTIPVGLGGQVASAEDTFRFWAHANNCDEPDPAEPLADKDRFDRTTVQLQRATGCDRGATVNFYTIVGGGHQVPGRTSRPSEKIDELLGAGNGDISAAMVFYLFLSGQAR